MPMNRDKLRKYGKRAGLVAIAWIALELAAAAAAVTFGAELFRR